MNLGNRLMNLWKVEVFYKPEVPDTIGNGILEDISDLGITGVHAVRTATVYWIEGNLDSQSIRRIATELLADPITQDYTYKSDDIPNQDWTIEVQFKPGVTDAVGDSTVKGINDIGITEVTSVRSGNKYSLSGELDAEVIETISKQLLMNDVIQTYSFQEPNS